MAAGMQLQRFVRRQPGTPEAERLVSAYSPFLRRPEWRPAMGVQTTQMRGDVLQMHDSLLECLPLCSRVRRRALTGLHDFVHGDFLMRHRRSACCSGFFPRALLGRQRTEDVIVVRQRGIVYVVVRECAQAWERFLCLRGEPCPPLQRFLFVYSLHSYRLLALGLPAT